MVEVVRSADDVQIQSVGRSGTGGVGRSATDGAIRRGRSTAGDPSVPRADRRTGDGLPREPRRGTNRRPRDHRRRLGRASVDREGSGRPVVSIDRGHDLVDGGRRRFSSRSSSSFGSRRSGRRDEGTRPPTDVPSRVCPIDHRVPETFRRRVSPVERERSSVVVEEDHDRAAPVTRPRQPGWRLPR